MTNSMYFASATWLVLVVGFIYRRNARLHVPLMILGILCDLGLVFYLALTRNAIGKAISLELSLLPQLHVFASAIATLLYLPVLLLGALLVLSSSNATIKKLHVRIALSALVFRTIGFCLMFSMLK